MRTLVLFSVMCGVVPNALAADIATTTSSPAASISGAAPVGKVTKIELNKAVIDLGASQGLEPGDVIEFYVEETSLLKDSKERKTLVMGKVIATSPTESVVELGPNERIPLGALATPNKQGRVTADAMAPPRLPGLWELRASARPLLGIDDAGGGVLAEVSLTRRFDFPMAIHANILPFALAGGSMRSPFGFAGSAIVTFDHHLLEIGLGLGWVSGNRDYLSQAAAGTSNFNARLTILQLGRIGAVDGIHLTVRNAFYLVESKFRVAHADGELLLPITANVALLGKGGGSDLNYGYFEAGMRFRLKGNGDEGSLFLIPTIGVAGIRDYIGPMVGLGIDLRL